jgi:hypothetical protein
MSAHPKIQKMCEEESDDHEAVAKLFEINDSINRTIERYKLIKKGDVEGAAKIPKGTLGTSGAGVSKGPNNELSLIDFGGPDDEVSSAPTASTSSASKPTGNALEDDLLGLSMSADDNYGSGAISLGGSNGFGVGSSSQGSHLSNAQIAGLYQHPQSAPVPQAFGSPSQSLFSSPPSSQQPAQVQSKADPFALLASSSQASRQASPFQFQQSTQPPSILAAKPPQAPIPSSLSAANPNVTTAADDEWDFASALPPSAPSTLVLTNSGVTIAWELSRLADQQGIIEIKSKVSNNTPLPVSEFTFQVAVTKVNIL